MTIMAVTVIPTRMTGMGAGEINGAAIMMGTVIKSMIAMIGGGTGIMNTGSTNILIKDTEAGLTAVITATHTGMKIETTITRGTGLHGATGKDINASIRTGSVMEDITVIMTTIFSSGFATRTATHVFSIQSAGKVSTG
ncbi:MAG: hypothetical protein WA081_05640 [Desulfosalsimonadaceae bacterium]